MRNILKNKKAEGYIDVAITVMIVAFILVFSVSMVSLVALNQNLKVAADQLLDYATLNGTTDVTGYAEDLKTKLNINFDYSFLGTAHFDGTSKVQLGDVIVCEVIYRVNILGFGETIHPFLIRASSSGLSQVYWK